MVIYTAAIDRIHVAIPSSIEPRKIYQIAPVMCLLALAGLDTLVRLLPDGFGHPRAQRYALAAVAGLVFFLTGFSLLPQYAPGFGEVVENLLARPETRGRRLLISSSPEWVDSEAALIAEWASRRRNDGEYLIRGNKLLSRAPANGERLRSRFIRAKPRFLTHCGRSPVSFVILDTTQSLFSYPRRHKLRRRSKATQRTGL